MEMTTYQKIKTDELYELYNRADKTIFNSNSSNGQKNLFSNKIHFSAPTGSGKTFIMFNLINQIFNQENNKIIVLFESLSMASLYNQNYNKFENYKYTNAANLMKLESINSPSSTSKGNSDQNVQIVLEDRKVYFIGSASYKNGSILYERGILNKFLANAKDNNYKVLYIKDEAHIGAKTQTQIKQGSKNILTLEKYFDVSIFISATLKRMQPADVIFTEEEAISDHLIKASLQRNAGLVTKGEDDIESDELVDRALEKFNKIKDEYKLLNEIPQINPALLLQIKSSKEGSSEELDDVKKINELIKKIESKGLSWCVWLSNNKFSSNQKKWNNKSYSSKLNELTQNNCSIDVIIFKVAVATGWDIPRACMLLQIRDVASETLNTQTIGRIRRNPLKNLATNPITDKYYIYTNFKSKKAEEIKFLQLKEKFKEYKFNSINLVEKANIKQSNEQIIKAIYEEILLKKNNNILKSFSQSCQESNNHKLIINYRKVEVSGELTKEIVENKYVSNIFDLEKIWRNNVTFEIREYINEALKLYAKKFNINLYYLKLSILNLEKEYQYIKDTIKIIKNVTEVNYDYEVSKKLFTLPFNTVEELFIEEIGEKGYIDLGYKKDSINKNINKREKYLLNDAKTYYGLVDKYAYDHNVSSTSYQTEIIDSSILYESRAERTFWLAIKKYFIFKGTKTKNIKMITKNYANNSKLRFQYWLNHQNTINSIANGYPDLIIQQGNKTFFIEIKSNNYDYDILKTASLKKAYKEYSKQIDYIFCIASVINDTAISLHTYYKGQEIDYYNGDKTMDNNTSQALEPKIAIEKLLEYQYDK